MKDLNLKVLVIDDQWSARAVASQLFSASGCNVVCAENGLAGTQEAKKDNFDLIVLDWEMPIMNGSQTLVALESLLKQSSQEQTNSRLPLILFTGNSAQKIDLPHAPSLELYDFWHKNEDLLTIEKKVSTTIHRLKKRFL